jgi:predicted O-methyltransferase YrrM
VLDLFAHLTRGHRDETSMDVAHAALIVSMVLSARPARVLELGIGPGYLTKALLLALRSNGRGTLTSVDSWYDWSGRRPDHIAELQSLGAEVVCSSEESFVRSCARAQFEIIVSDADHFRSHEWFEDTLRLLTAEGVAFFHDTNQPRAFPGLATLPSRARALGFPCRHYTSSRGEDRCDRGLLVVLKPAV